jgi:hypothetical protein
MMDEGDKKERRNIQILNGKLPTEKFLFIIDRENYTEWDVRLHKLIAPINNFFRDLQKDAPAKRLEFLKNNFFFLVNLISGQSVTLHFKYDTLENNPQKISWKERISCFTIFRIYIFIKF